MESIKTKKQIFLNIRYRIKRVHPYKDNKSRSEPLAFSRYSTNIQ